MKKILSGLPFESSSDKEKVRFLDGPKAELIKSNPIEHSGNNGLITAPNIFYNSDEDGYFVQEDVSKYLVITGATQSTGPIYIKEVLDGNRLILNWPGFISEAGVSWRLVSWKSEYPSEAEVYTELLSANSIKSLLNFEAISTIPDGTSITYRLSDGTDDYYWDGVSWLKPVHESQWSTEDQINTNISSYDVSSLKLRVRAKLSSDGLNTPTLRGVYVRWQGELSFNYDLYHSFIAYLKDISAGDWVEDSMTSVTTIDLISLVDQVHEDQITGVAGVYNMSDDPTDNLLSSYIKPTITLTKESTGNLRAFFTYTPRVVMWADLDYPEIELHSAPSVAVDGLKEAMRFKFGGEAVSAHWLHKNPTQVSIEVNLVLGAQSLRTLTWLGDAVEGKIRNTPTVNLEAIGEIVSLVTIQGFQIEAKNMLSNYKEGTLRLHIALHSKYYEEPIQTDEISGVSFIQSLL